MPEVIFLGDKNVQLTVFRWSEIALLVLHLFSETRWLSWTICKSPQTC